jgi:hypothetical protein
VGCFVRRLWHQHYSHYPPWQAEPPLPKGGVEIKDRPLVLQIVPRVLLCYLHRGRAGRDTLYDALRGCGGICVGAIISTGGPGPMRHMRSSSHQSIDHGVDIVIDELILQDLSVREAQWLEEMEQTEPMHNFSNDADEIVLAKRQCLQQIKAACDKP